MAEKLFGNGLKVGRLCLRKSKHKPPRTAIVAISDSKEGLQRRILRAGCRDNRRPLFG